MMEGLKSRYAELDQPMKAIVWLVGGLVLFLLLLRIILWVIPSHPPAERQFMRKLSSRNPLEVRDAILALSNAGYKPAAPQIDRIMQEAANEPMRNTAAAALLKIDPDKLYAHLKSQNKELRTFVMEVVYRYDKANVDRLFEDYAKEDTATKLRLLGYAAGINTSVMRQRLVQAGANTAERPEVRQAALSHLQHVGTADEQLGLWRICEQDPDPEMKKQARAVIDLIAARQRGEAKK